MHSILSPNYKLITFIFFLGHLTLKKTNKQKGESFSATTFRGFVKSFERDAVSDVSYDGEKAKLM